MTRFARIFWLVGLALTLCACQGNAMPTAVHEVETQSSENQLAVTELPPVESQLPATVTVPPAPGQCGYVWANQDRPEVAETVQAVLNGAGLADARVRAQAFGENCVLADGTVDHFATMYTDLFVSIPVADLADEPALGNWLEPVLGVVRGLPPGTLPGGNTTGGYLGVEFRQGEQVRNLWFERTRGYAALDEGKRGADLLQALTNN
jgi:hypothetical protein